MNDALGAAEPLQDSQVCRATHLRPLLWCTLTLAGVAALAPAGIAQTGAAGVMPAPGARILPASTAADPTVGGDAMSADRPGFTEPPDVLRRGVLQLEGGTSFSVDCGPAAVEYNLVEGSPLLRAGIGGGIELRFAGDGFRLWKNERLESVERARGVSDFSIGAKVKLRDESRFLPAIAILPSLSLPIGHVQFSSSAPDPTIKLAWAKALVHGFSAGGNVASSWVTGQKARLLQKGYSLSLAHNLPGRLGGYWEVYRISPTDVGSTWMFNTGVTRTVQRNTQFDIEVGRTLKPAAPHWFVAAGIAVRLTPGLPRGSRTKSM